MIIGKEDSADKRIILVDEDDNVLGYGEKMEVHKRGQLHRCFSVMVVNSEGKVLLQKRAQGKYHCPGLWSNTCCSHPYPQEDIKAAAKRRLREEMGFDCELEKIGVFHYKAEFDNGLTENEIDHLFKGKYDGKIAPDPAEVGDIKRIDIEALKKDIEENPNDYTVWLKIIMERFWQQLSVN